MPVTYAAVLARNVRAARAAAGLDQEPLANRMRDLGFASWRRQTVANVEKEKRQLAVEEVFGLAIALGTSIGTLMDPRREDALIELPSGRSVAVMSVLWSVRHFNDGMVWWENGELRIDADGEPKNDPPVEEFNYDDFTPEMMRARSEKIDRIRGGYVEPGPPPSRGEREESDRRWNPGDLR